MVIFYHASARNVKKIILSYVYVELCYSENEIFHIFTYITAAVRQMAKDTDFNYFYRILHKIVNILIYKTLRNDYTKLEKILLQTNTRTFAN